MCSKSTTKGPGWHRSGRSTANFKRAQHINIVFSFLTSKKKLAAGIHKGVAIGFFLLTLNTLFTHRRGIGLINCTLI